MSRLALPIWRGSSSSILLASRPVVRVPRTQDRRGPQTRTLQPRQTKDSTTIPENHHVIEIRTAREWRRAPWKGQCRRGQGEKKSSLCLCCFSSFGGRAGASLTFSRASSIAPRVAIGLAGRGAEGREFGRASGTSAALCVPFVGRRALPPPHAC